MALRPFVIKHAFYLPGHTGFGQGTHGALAHLDYMGDPARHKKFDEELLMGDPAIHAKYMAERPGTAGYFGSDPRRLPDIATIQATLSTHTGPIWRDFVSVTEADAWTLGGGLMTRAGWEHAARTQLPQMFAQMGLDPTRVEWVASVHKKAGHPHLHLLYWEQEPHRIKGQWSDQERIRIRKGWVQQLYGPERTRLGQEKSVLRQQIVWQVQSQEMGCVDPRMQQAWTDQLTHLAERLPGHGRVALQYMPPAVKAEVQQAAHWLFTQSPVFHQALNRYRAIAEEMAQHYSDDSGQLQKAGDKAQADLTDRVAQRILQEAAGLERTLRWDIIRTMVHSDDPHIAPALRRLSQLTGADRVDAIHAYATELRGDRPASSYQRPLEREITYAVKYFEDARRHQAALSLRRVFSSLQGTLQQAEAANRRAAAQRRWASAKEAWAEAMRAKGLSEETIAAIERE